MKILDIFKKCQEITMSKRQDYTTNPNVNNHENFERSSEIASWFSNKRDISYTVLIGTKLARLGSLLSSGRAPNNEAIDDTFQDLINYCALWYERYSEENQSNLISDKSLISISTEHKTNEELLRTMIPEICSTCRDGSVVDMIKHAVVMHSAIYIKSSNSLKYPNKPSILLWSAITNILAVDGINDDTQF